MGQPKQTSFIVSNHHRSHTLRTNPVYPSFTLALAGHSQRLRKSRTPVPVTQAVAGWGMKTIHYRSEPELSNAHDTEVRPNTQYDTPSHLLTSDDSSEIGVLVMEEPAVGSTALQKLRDVQCYHSTRNPSAS